MTEQIGKITLDLTHYPGEDLYCDGQVEDELLEIAKNYSAVEYQKIIEEKASWPILYHLSPLRENTVDWIPMSPEDKVLEIGSGCGAITGALARKAGEVVCVDLSKKRSMINAYRHSECENITIHVGNFKDIEPDLPADFDYIYLVGVFEYAQGYMGGERPYEAFLSIVMKHLKHGGRVVIAIENKYGLKYFAGCKEDHLGTWFSGVENYADGGGVRTFSRRGLERIFAACGVKNYHFYYPYPDYKFMTTLYSDAYLPCRGELSNNLRNFDRDRMLLFDEKHAFDGIVEDNLFSVFSNSYTVIIGDGFDVKYVKYSNDRAREYRIRTEICRDADGHAVVKKIPLCEEANEHIRGMEAACRSLSERYAGGRIGINRCTLHEENGQVWDSFEFLEGRLLSEMMDECLEKQDQEGFRRLFCEYLERTGYNSDYPVSDFDLIFGNIMVQGEDWTIIDYEWTFGRSMDTVELAFRAVYCYLLEDERRNALDPDWVLATLGITEQDAKQYREQEMNFQKFVTGQRLSMAQLRERIGGELLKPTEWVHRFKASENVLRVQIYEDRGSGFSEEESYFLHGAYISEELAEMEFTLDGNVRSVRIDPAMCPCVCKVREFTFNGRTVSVNDKKRVGVNGRLLRPAEGSGDMPGVVFPTEDPNITLWLEGLERNAEDVVSLKLEVVKLPQDLAKDMAAAVKKLF